MTLIDADNLPTGDEKAARVRNMFDVIAPRYDLVNRIMTFGLDIRWRRKAVLGLGLPSGSRVADIACGTGDFCRELHASGIDVVGVDLSLGMLMSARTSAPLMEADALHLPFGAGTLDGATCGFALRNFVSLPDVLTELGRVIRPGGRIALLEVDQPTNRLFRIGHDLYFGRVVPLIGGLFSDKSAYQYLPKSVEYLPPPAELVEAVRAAGFAAVQRHTLTLGVAQLIVATRSAERDDPRDCS